jgi:chemotaxis family two-component system sensor kinase Cph1
MSPRAVAAGGGRAARTGEDLLLDAFAARAAHALGTGVSITGGYATLLRERFAEPLGPDGATALDGLEGGLDRLRLFVDDLLELTGLDAAPLKRAPFGAAGSARAAVGALAGPLTDANITVELGDLPEVVADPALLERLFHHLLRGALAAIGEGPGRIAISGAQRPAGVRIAVADSGPALDPAVAAELFQPFATPRGSGPATGAGLSMPIARRIAERHGGSVWAHTGRREGCTIVVLLPEAAPA